MRARVLLVLSLLLVAGPSLAQQATQAHIQSAPNAPYFPRNVYSPNAERITDFREGVAIHPDSTMTVEEIITVVASGRQIKHGIYRDFPVDYKTPSGANISVGFHVARVQRDGAEIPWHTESHGNMMRVYMGDGKTLLPPGEHSYTLDYEIDRQLGYFKDYDELYWNVTGNGWSFPIEHVESAITLPPGGKLVQQTGYTGSTGAQGRDYTESQSDDGTIIYYRSTRTFQPGEGLTIAVAWPKGLVREPTVLERFGYMMRDNPILPLGALAVLVLISFYAYTWNRYGRGPRQGTVIPLFAPPNNMSPAEVNYCISNRFKDGGKAAFGAALVDMAVKRGVKIVAQGKNFMLQKTAEKADNLAEEEKTIFYGLLEERKEFLLPTGSAMWGEAMSGHMADFAADRATMNATFMQFVASVKTFITSAHDFVDNGKIIILSFVVSLACVILVPLATARSGGAPFFPILFGATFVVQLVYTRFMSRVPTPEGRKVIDQIAGFKMYLSTAEQSRLNALTPPQMTPDVFEKFLPYAMALGVANQWGKKFDAVLASGLYQNYQPVWYAGPGWSPGNIGGFTDSFSSGLSSAVAAAAPGASSGSGGAGGSGGGGGGGGGGGF